MLTLAQGWGSKEEGLGLFSCVEAAEEAQDDSMCLFPSEEITQDGTRSRLGSTLHFEFYVPASTGKGEIVGDKPPTNLCVIQVPDLHLYKDDDLALLRRFVQQYNVPPEHRFSLFSRIRYAHAFHSRRACKIYARICILAFIVLVQSGDAHDELFSFFANEPGITNELISLVRSEGSVPGSIRSLAMHALGAQLAAYTSSHERARVLSGSSIISAGGNRMMLLTELQKAVVSLNSVTDPSHLSFVNALLQFFLLHVLSSSSSGSTIRGLGMVPPLLPLLQDNDPSHVNLVYSAVKILQKLMEYSNPAVSLFKDLGGVEILSQRLQIEVQRAICADDQSGSSSGMITGDSSKAEENNIYFQKRLIKVLLKALGSATYSPANSTRSHSSSDNILPASLSLIFRNVKKFGGDIYFSAVTLMSEIIHKDPMCFPVLHELGLPDAFLYSVSSGILPSAKALICIPSGLGAICLNAKGLEAVKETAALRFLVNIFTFKRYLVAMNEGVVLLANAMEELLRHVSSLRSIGVDIIIEIIEKLASLGDQNTFGQSSRLDDNTTMETENEDSSQKGHDLVSSMDTDADGVSEEQFVQMCIFHVMVLVHRVTENTETCRLFVEKKGIEALMKLLLRPNIAQSSDGMPIALHSTVVFKGFTQHHSGPLANAFCSSLREHLAKALSIFSSMSGSFILSPFAKSDNTMFSPLFVVEFLLFLAASKDNRWISALLAEFGNGSKDVLEDIGRLHREVLWQIALIEDTKIAGMERESSSTSEGPSSNATTDESDDRRLNSFRQYVDPLFRRRGPGWSIESQFLDLISMYRDINHPSRTTRRLDMDDSGPLRLTDTQSHVPISREDGVAVRPAEAEDKQKSYYSCREMLRSLAYHIGHLFLELGSTMLPSPRRTNDPVNVSASAKSVVSIFAAITLDHLNFGGRVVAPSSVADASSLRTKCRYLGKVVDFIDGILLDKPESCNPIVVNCFYGSGVIQAVLTTFEATSQLLSAVNRAPASPMDTDAENVASVENEETDHSWLFGPLTSYGTLLDHLVTSQFVISSSTKPLLEQPLTSVNVPFPQDAETLVKVLQSKVLNVVLPVWNHPHLSDGDSEFIMTTISIMRHVYSGVEIRSANSMVGGRVTGPPPDESIISLIVEMGFSRSRAEEALRQVGSNSVELATDWLFLHPEEPQEDDELARALAMSLGNNVSAVKEDTSSDTNTGSMDHEELAQPPSVDELLSSCIKLMQVKESLVFPVRDLIVMVCGQNNGENRPKVLASIVDHLRNCIISDLGNCTKLAALFHVIALILHEDTASREVALRNGLISIVLDLLSQWLPDSHDGENTQVPKYVTTSFLAIDRILQVDPKVALEVRVTEQLKKSDTGQSPLVIDGGKQPHLQTGALVVSSLDGEDQKRLIEIACNCIRKKLPSETMHVILQLCATLTKVHSVALDFLDAGGLVALFGLPTSSLFPGFDSMASSIVRHILEDPQTLQQAMESEIRRSLVAAASRHSNGRVTPHSFVQSLSSVIFRDPVLFMQAAKSVCQVETVGERSYVVLKKDREKDKSKEKEKEKDKDKDKQSGGDSNFVPLKSPESTVKSAKVHRKSPQSFTTVIDFLLDSIITFVPPMKIEDKTLASASCTPADMEIDSTSVKGKGKAIVATLDVSNAENQEALASLAKTVFILKLLTEILLTYPSSVHVLLRRDTELCNFHGPSRESSAHFGGLFHHVLHKFLPLAGMQKRDKKTEGDWRHKLVTRANQFLVASAVRSPEARKRIFGDINNVFNEFVIASADSPSSPTTEIHAFTDLLNDALSARLPTGSPISAEASVSFIDVGLVKSMTRTLEVLDLDHSDSLKVVSGIVKALELVTKEHVHSADVNKGNTLMKPADEGQQEGIIATRNMFQALETISQPDSNTAAAEQLQAPGGSDFLTDDMDHDRDLDGIFAAEGEDDFMHESSEAGGDNENPAATVEIRFDIPRNMDGDDDDDDVMSGGDEGEGEEDDDDEDDDGEDEDEEDEENNYLEEDEVHHMSHQDTDQEDHEMDDEFDEDVLVEEEEDDEDDNEGVIFRLEDGINGINVFDHIEVFGGGNNFSNETLRVMPLEVFGSRRQGRSTSIINLLGRSGNQGVVAEHPYLVDPSSRPSANQRQFGEHPTLVSVTYLFIIHSPV